MDGRKEGRKEGLTKYINGMVKTNGKRKSASGGVRAHNLTE